jgi:hypothetical protein
MSATRNRLVRRLQSGTKFAIPYNDHGFLLVFNTYWLSNSVHCVVTDDFRFRRIGGIGRLVAHTGTSYQSVQRP